VPSEIRTECPASSLPPQIDGWTMNVPKVIPNLSLITWWEVPRNKSLTSHWYDQVMGVAVPGR
jgi:hypothetical protein